MSVGFQIHAQPLSSYIYAEQPRCDLKPVGPNPTVRRAAQLSWGSTAGFVQRKHYFCDIHSVFSKACSGCELQTSF